MAYKNDRIKRCYSDNLYLIDSLPIDVDHPLDRSYIVMGNSRNTYQVTISNYPKCTCYDNQKYGRRCKHIFFVLLRIMNAANINRKKFSDSELVSMYINIPTITKDLIYQGEKPKIKEGVEQKFDEGDQCPICLEPLENSKELDFCKYSCGKTIHKQCFQMWKMTKGNVCVYCRAKWYVDGEEFYHKTVSYHPIKKNENKTVNEQTPNNNNNANTNGNNNETNNNIEEENFDEINEKINLILENTGKFDLDQIKVKKKRGRKKVDDGTNGTIGTNNNNSNNNRSKKKRKNKENDNLEQEKKENGFLENGIRSRSRSKEKIDV